MRGSLVAFLTDVSKMPDNLPLSCSHRHKNEGVENVLNDKEHQFLFYEKKVN